MPHRLQASTGTVMRRTTSALSFALLLAAALFGPLVFLRPAAETLDAGSATPPPNATAIAERTSPPAEESDQSCGTATVSYDAAEPTIANRAEGASVVVIATVESVGAARWNTDDGRAPAFDQNPPEDAYVYRPVSLSIATLARGDLLDSTLEAHALGGSVGCYSFEVEDNPKLESGDQYAFFLAPALADDGETDTSELSINAAWPVTAGRVSTPVEGRVALPLFLASVEIAPVGPLGD